MKICFITQEWPGENDTGGIGFHYQNLAKYLTQQDHTVTIIYSGNKNKTLNKNLYLVGTNSIFINKAAHSLWHRFPLRLLRSLLYKTAPELLEVLEWNLAALTTFFSLFMNHHVDVTETHEYHSTPLLLLLKLKTKLIVNFQGSKKTTSMLNQEWSGWETKTLHLLEKIFVSQVKYRYANSYTTKQKSEQNFDIKVPKVIFNAVDTEYFFSPGKKTHHQNHQSYILYVGRLERRKGVELLIQAYQALNRRVKNVPSLYLLGTDLPQFSDKSGHKVFFHQYVKKHYPRQLREKIIFRNHVPHQKLKAIYQRSLFCVFPSLYEPFGNVIVEAMSCEKAIITTSGGTQAFLKNGQNGVLIDPKLEPLTKALRKLLADPKFLRKIAYNARRTIESECSIPIIGKQTLNFYKKIV